MLYYSLSDPLYTRSFSEAVIEGQALGGGLFFPQEIPFSKEIMTSPSALSLSELAVRLLEPMVTPDLQVETLRKICQETFNFPIPLVQVEPKLWVLELFHGPTAAFKDVGARFLSRVISAISKRRLTILVATSGDTGGAVAHGFHGVEGVDVVILYPKGRVSPLQERQLTELGGNITALEVDGSFDDCQRMVKSALRDEELKRVRPLSSANSINIARWLPQSVYYAWALQQLQERVKHVDPRPIMIVPSGNLGNLAAGIFAWRRGVKIGEMIAATNRNDGFCQYVKTGHFKAFPSVHTPSNAMDVGDPSNRTRVEALFGSDLTRLRSQLKAHSVTDLETLESIKQAYQSRDYLLCPHSAVGYASYLHQLHQGRANLEQEYILLATAHPAKFAEVVSPLIGEAPKLPLALQELSALSIPSYPSSSLPPNERALKDYLYSSLTS